MNNKEEEIVEEELSKYLTFDDPVPLKSDSSRTPMPREWREVQQISEEEAILQRAEYKTEEESIETHEDGFTHTDKMAMSDAMDETIAHNTQEHSAALLDIEELPNMEGLAKNHATIHGAEEKTKKKLLPLYVGVFSLVLGAGAFYLWRVTFVKHEALPKQHTTEDVLQIVNMTPTKQEEIKKTPQNEHYSVPFEPFIIELKNNREGKFLLSISLALGTDDPKIVEEIDTKKAIIRDAVYAFLRTLDFNTPHHAILQAKKDILEVVNQYISQGNVKEVAIGNVLLE